jgi:adenosylcobinamide-GDP ribazoletransferase
VGSARAALAFLTPFGGATNPTPSALGWFPAVGAAIGLSLGLLWWATSRAWPLGVSAAFVVVADLGLTGLLHLDGLVDSADGLLPHLDRARRLEVMREPTIGAFGVGAAVAVLLTRWAALSALRPSILLLGGLWCGSRTIMAVAARVLPYARSQNGGLASAFVGSSRRYVVVAAIVGVGGLLAGVLLWRPLAGSVAAVCGLVVAGTVLWFACRRIGGFTGDVLGAAGLVFETVALAVAAAKW